jgi:hypothetical protein
LLGSVEEGIRSSETVGARGGETGAATVVQSGGDKEQMRHGRLVAPGTHMRERDFTGWASRAGLFSNSGGLDPLNIQTNF